MMDEELKCKQCGEATSELDASGACASCSQIEQATIAPAPNLTEDATVLLPAKSHPQAFSDERIGDYDLIEEIARGGMGVVYKANHRNLNRTSAVKMILGGRFSSPEEVQRFRIEAESAAKLDHPAIVPIYEIGEHDGQPFFAMKYIDGGSLAEKAASFVGKPREAAQLMQRVAEGVHHAHQRGVLHRDLKPANILLDQSGQPWVTDLGLAKSTSGGSNLTQTGAVLGTPAYMPPEQAAGKSVTTSADVYSLGAILYQLLVGRAPYQGDTTVSIVMKVIDGPPASPRAVNSEVDRELELIVQKCMAREPGERYSSAKDLADDLGSWLEGKPISVQPPSIRALVGKWFREHQQLAYAMFAICVGILMCVPALIGFFSDDLSDVYSKFPETEKPFLFSFNPPGWLVGMSAIFFGLILWPSIGWMNASVSKPKSLLGAVRSGVTTAAVLALIFYCLMGWVVFLQGANNSINQDVEALTKHVWPNDAQAKEGVVGLDDIYPGLEQVPEEERAAVVARRIRADVYASAPIAFLIGLMIAVAFAIPIVIGTVIGYVLSERSIPRWVRILRYMIAWWTSSAFWLLAYVLSVVSLLGLWTDVRVSVQGIDPTRNTFVTLGVMLLIIWLVLRRWKKEEKLSLA